jgi:hypothetical protein
MVARMERLFVECIAFMIDRVPYALGRVAIFIFTFDSVECEPWEPILRETNPFAHQWWIKEGNDIIATHWGARWVGFFVIILLFFSMIGAVVWWISKL